MGAYTGIVKSVNESAIVKELLKGERVTRQRLVKLTGLSFPTVGKTVDMLVSKKLLLNLGTEEFSQGGRKAELFQLNPEGVYSLSLYVQRKLIYCIVADALGNIVMRRGYRPGESGYIGRMEEIIRDQLADYPRIEAIAIGVPGGVSRGTICYIDGYEELRQINLQKIIEDCISIPTLVENNMRVVVYGFAARNRNHKNEAVVCIHIEDNGPGLGILIHGKPVSGFSGFVGEAGFLPFYTDRNLQQIALEEFKDCDKTDYFARLIAGICVFCNPEEVILYKNNEYIGRAQDIYTSCLKYIPEMAMPKLHMSETYYEDYEAGLSELAREILFPSYRIVEGI